MRLLTLTLGVVITLAPLAASAQSSSTIAAGTIEKIEAASADNAQSVVVKNGQAEQRLSQSETIYLNDTIVTAADQSVTLKMRDESEVTIGPSTELAVKHAYESPSDSPTLKMAFGYIHAFVKKLTSRERPFVIETPESVMGVRGTEFVVEHSKDGQTNLHTLEGAVAMAPTGNDIVRPKVFELVGAGQMSQFKRGMARPNRPRAFNREQLFARLEKRAPLFMKRLKHRFKSATPEQRQKMRRQLKDRAKGRLEGRRGQFQKPGARLRNNRPAGAAARPARRPGR